MPNKNRDYGLAWERELVNLFKVFSNAKRKPASGAYGTLVHDPALQGDLSFDVDGFNFLVEAKAGYGGAQSIALKREWLDKITLEATSQTPPRIPLLALKLRGGKTSTSKLIVLSLDTFMSLLCRIEDLIKQLDTAYTLLREYQIRESQETMSQVNNG